MSAPKEDPVVIANNITKCFRIPLEASSGIKQKLVNIVKGRKGYREFTPLNDISFTINKGDFFGIVGRNGSGKSTLLKTLAGIYAPNSGEIHINGTLVPFIELGVGFNPELTGKENIFLNGALLGFSRKQIEEMYADIVDFA
ncbi:ABC transporter ATP-binding protein, partial [Candidatus Saccharibacteria bacterium]|nr:ABC transporter ATP-binding protein [Candidatus Saccharibacteria bacterium]